MAEHSSLDERVSVPHYLFIYLVIYLLWLLLVGTTAVEEMLAGTLVALVVTLAAAPRLGIFTGLRLHFGAPWHLLRYLGHFLLALVYANIDMARRVLSPSLPIRPAVVEVQTHLHSALGRLLLANSITLTPGTLSVDVRGDHILVHWIDCPPGTDMQAATRRIAAGFERHLQGFLL